MTPGTRPRIVTALPVPFDPGGELDLPALAALTRRLLDRGVDGFFAAGTTGEFPALDDDERIAVIETVLAVAGPERVVAHVGAASARQATRLARRAVAVGAVELAAITPYYLPCGPDALRAYFSEVAAAAEPARLLAYIFPGLTGTTVSPAQLAGLAAIPNLVGAKVSGLGMAEFRAYRIATPDTFALYSGADRELVAVAAAGGAGVVSGVSAVLPSVFVALADAVAAADPAAVSGAEPSVHRAVDALGAGIGLLKHGLWRLGLATDVARMGIDPPSVEERAHVDAALGLDAAVPGLAGGR